MAIHIHQTGTPVLEPDERLYFDVMMTDAGCSRCDGHVPTGAAVAFLERPDDRYVASWLLCEPCARAVAMGAVEARRSLTLVKPESQ